ncbi:MAG TPA: anthranilate synthase component I [Armatimonadota bacterium]|nr:anthranilate synthase component I [Armatimonadota bacterium]
MTDTLAPHTHAPGALNVSAGLPLLKSISALSPAVDIRPRVDRYVSSGGITITRTVEPVDLNEVLEPPRRALDNRRGGVFTSNYEYPDRYRRFEIAFVDPPLLIEGRGRSFIIRALNPRGEALLSPILKALNGAAHVLAVEQNGAELSGKIRTPEGAFAEEERSHQPSIFSLLRVFHGLFGSMEDPHLGLYGAFGYDLVFQFEPIPQRQQRSDDPDLTLYLPDEILIADRIKDSSYRSRYDFEYDGVSTHGLPRTGEDLPHSPSRTAPECDHAPGEYASVVERVREGCRQGDFFEVVPGQVFSIPCPALPSALFQRLCERNPSPYGFLLNLGSEQLIGASPEMFVRVEGARIETCPISGTIARGRDAIADADQILTLLNSSKDESELTMCTDVDRNDKSRICVPGSVRVVGRRQVEMYSRVIHTVDHVEGRLREGFDALDAFLSHTWAVTVTGAPKRAAMEFIEQNEKSPRRYYGGAVGFFTFNGAINTGITIRTIRLAGGVAEVRAGATLLYDSVPEDEERETRTKAAAMLDVIRQASAAVTGQQTPTQAEGVVSSSEVRPPRVLLVDHQDSFVHTLANYLRQAGAEVITLRAPVDQSTLDKYHPDLVTLSPGPGRPVDHGVPALVRLCAETGTPVFGVCLGLQGMVEAFGGRLGVLPEPVHGKASLIRRQDHWLFEGMPEQFQAGRYHSLFAEPDALPDCLAPIADSEDGVLMAVAHRTLPMVAVQFHPESLLTLHGEHGLQLIRNALRRLARAPMV